MKPTYLSDFQQQYERQLILAVAASFVVAMLAFGAVEAVSRLLDAQDDAIECQVEAMVFEAGPGQALIYEGNATFKIKRADDE